MDTCSALRFVIIGHVDHGKSTLIGRLFHDTRSLPDGKYEQLVAAAARRGVPFEFANLMDALQAERDQNVTIDTAQIWFTWSGRRYVIIDAPGHKEFVKNMVTGASQADAAVLMVDVVEGVREQTRRHASLVKLLGLDQVLVVINKMDLVGYRRDRFETLAAECRAFLAECGLTPSGMLPLSASLGDNVVTRSAPLSWYDGPTFVEALAQLRRADAPANQPLRMPVQDVYRFDHRRVIAGRLESGTLCEGDAVVFLPSGRQSTVKTIERWSAPSATEAGPGDSVGITLTEQVFVDRGDVACHPDHAAPVTSAFRARVFWLGRDPLVTGRTYSLRLTTEEVECEVASIARVVDAATLVETGRTGVVSANDVADLVIRTARPVACDPHDRVPALGRFVLVDGQDVAGGGIVVALGGEVESAGSPGRNVTRSVSAVTQEERQKHHRHRGAVVWLTGLSGSGKSTIATAVERELFDRGLQVFVLDGDNIRFGLSADLGFSAADRAENIRRVAETAKLFAEAGLIAITAFISPYRSDRARARQVLQEGNVAIPFTEVFVDAPLEVCEARDPKHLYAKARAGTIKEFTGISAPYEAPEAPDLVVHTDRASVQEAVTAILDHLLPRIR
jgi:bifunctional enzyme CysN/CysC